MTPALNALFDDFALLDDWEERYRYLIELGRDLPPLRPEERTDATRVEGCMSNVWLVVDHRPDGRLVLRAESDAHIVRGLIAVLLAACSGLTAAELAQVNMDAVFDRLGLGQHLSPNRRNGFFAMTERIRTLAREPSSPSS